jgi:C1A family cysteine protease
LFQYFSERQRDSDIDRDGGSTIRTAVKSLAGTGVPRIDLWPYDTSKFAQTPPAEAYTDALLHKATEYVSIPQVEYNIKHAIAGSFPVIFGATIYQSFESGSVAKTGIVPMPQLSESVCGGHALLICGFSDDVELIPGIKGWFTVRNSWGPDFGDAGYVYFPYGYVTNPGLASDFWCVTGIERS